ncbi:MAG: glycerol kinase GlpK [Anaerovoracaceae bacterium]|jgi:glycerol kinase
MKQFIMALDQGTTSSRAILYDKKGEVVSVAQKEVQQYYPEDGWVEQDPMEIWSTQMGVAQEALFKVNATYKNVAAIGITNQRETTIIWDKETGEPIYKAIVWQCRRTAEYCDQLKDRGLAPMIQKKTGLLPDAYFSGTKIKWILDNVPGARKKAKEGRLLFGTVETWLIWKLTEGRLHISDYSNASRTMIFNIHDLSWDEDLLQLLDIPASILPTPVDNSRIYGNTEGRIFGGEVPIAGAAGDQQASLFGQTCFQRGEGKMTFGTGGFMLMNTGHDSVISKNGLLSTIAWGLDGKIHYALEGSVFVAGAAIQWLRDELGILDASPQSEDFARTVDDAGGVVFVPAMVGLGAPYWDPYARGAYFGLTRGTKKAHMIRATLESMVYQTKDLADAMGADSGQPIHTFRVDGGASENDFLMQFLADMLKQNIVRPASVETTSLGAAYLAGLAVGYWESPQDIKNQSKKVKTFTPNMADDERDELLRLWHRGVERTLNWLE